MESKTTTGKALIYERIAAIMAEVPAIGKNNQNQEQRYRFRGIDDVYNSLHPLFVKHQVFTTSEILNKNREVWTNKNGTIMIEFTLQVKYRFTAIDGSSIETETMGQAMDSSDKASNKAMSMAHKAAILQIFMIPTLDIEDADANTPEPQAHGYQQQPQQNGYTERARTPQEHRPPVAPQQQNGYNRANQQPNDRPASAKSLQYLRDLSGRPKVSEGEASQIENSIQGGLTADECSAMIDSVNAFLQGHRLSIFQEADHLEPVQQEKEYNDLPF